MAERREARAEFRERGSSGQEGRGVKQTRLQTRGDRRHSERTEGETTVLLGESRRAGSSIAGSLLLEPAAKETSLGSSSAPAGPMQDGTKLQHSALTGAPFSPALPFFDLT